MLRDFSSEAEVKSLNSEPSILNVLRYQQTVSVRSTMSFLNASSPLKAKGSVTCIHRESSKFMFLASAKSPICSRQPPLKLSRCRSAAVVVNVSNNNDRVSNCFIIVVVSIIYTNCHTSCGVMTWNVEPG